MHWPWLCCGPRCWLRWCLALEERRSWRSWIYLR